MTESIILSFKENRPAHLLANTLSNDKYECASFANYFQDKNPDLDYQPTQKKIVEILNKDEAKLNAFFTALDNIFQQKSFTQTHYGPIEDIVGALQEVSIDIYDKVSSLANNSTWGKKLLDLLNLNNEASFFYESYLGSSSKSQAGTIEDQKGLVILPFSPK